RFGGITNQQVNLSGTEICLVNTHYLSVLPYLDPYPFEVLGPHEINETLFIHADHITLLVYPVTFKYYLQAQLGSGQLYEIAYGRRNPRGYHVIRRLILLQYQVHRPDIILRMTPVA